MSGKHPRPSWPELCRARLVGALEETRRHLERHLEGEARLGMAHSQPHSSTPRAALDLLNAAFELSPFELQVLLLCAGVELDARIAGLCSKLHGDTRRRYATFALALAALPGAHWDATAPSAALRRWRLVRLEPGEGLVERGLRIEERVLHYLIGLSYLEPSLEGLVRPVSGRELLCQSQRLAAERAAALLQQEAELGRRPVLQLVGSGRRERRATVREACDQLGLALHVARDVDLPLDPSSRDGLVEVWAREAILTRSALLLELESDSPERRPAISSLLETMSGVLFISGTNSIELVGRRLIRLEVHAPTPAEQRARWGELLKDEQATGAGGSQDETALVAALDAVVGQFSLSPSAIDDLIAQARAASPEDLGAFLWEAARQRVRPGLGGLAQRIDPSANWNQLVLPDAQRATLREISVHVRQRQQVYETWGFGLHSSRGLGINALFAGPSGTGKTMAAEVLADELRLDLVHVDLSRIVSKYIGETEKNLGRIFDAADVGGAILLFDEADALFGRRSEVKDSHDRYANIEVSYLLQRMESYRGLAILTTNLEANLDPAFLRRIRFVVRFPYPEAAQRSEIWRRIFPSQTPTENLDYKRLGQLDLPGGNIRNIALHAAFLAADAQSPVTMPLLATAARNELRKLGRTPPERELKGWA